MPLGPMNRNSAPLASGNQACPRSTIASANLDCHSSEARQRAQPMWSSSGGKLISSSGLTIFRISDIVNLLDDMAAAAPAQAVWQDKGTPHDTHARERLRRFRAS